jgi:two-component system sensor histidine kinase KdpD
MTDTRPDPDRILDRLRQEEAQARRGKLKIFFGASAGVGKTYAMLAAARTLREHGTDVVIGIVETHGRADTQALTAGFELLPLREARHRERVLHDFDLDAALARKPALVLVDELAHSNVAGSRHPKRWQDVEELLDAGIDVWSTINVQHLETLNDVVSGITGIRVWETVPDRVFDHADEVVIVDLTPDELLQRLKEGKVYMPQQAATALRNFFRKGNLIALRELALRRTADRVDEQMLQYRSTQTAPPIWQTREALLLCVGPDERSEKLVRATARLAAQLDVPWHCICVETPAMQRQPDATRQRVLRLLKLAQESGAETASPSGDDLPSTIVRYAHEHNLSRVVLGRDTCRRHRPWRTTLTEAVGRAGPDLDVVQIALPPLAREGARKRPSMPATTTAQGIEWLPYAMSVAVCAAVALLATPLHDVLDLSNIVMLFLLGVVAVAMRWGRGPAVLAAFVSVAAFDFLVVPPRYSFSVADAQYLITFAVMLIVGLVVGQLTAGLRWQAQVAASREARVRALYAMSRDLSAALMPEEIAEIAARFLDGEVDARAALLVADDHDRVHAPVPLASLPAGIDAGIAQWAFDHAESAGHGTNTLPASPILYLPLKAPMRMRGVLALEPRQPARLAGPEQRRLLETCASLLALSLERIHYIEVARSTTVQMESERLRHSLLAAISHDLRTPLAALVAMADTLVAEADDERLAPTARRMREAAMRMSSQVSNLLDMARLQSGQVRLRRQWLPLEEAVGSALRAMAPALAPERVRVSLAPDLPLLSVDPALFERVLCNLLENAEKFAPAGSPIAIGAAAIGGHIRITIDDEGPGLPKQREEAIFEMFERGRREGTAPGAGLGLAICRAIVHAHDGTIRGETKAGGGARFTIELPRLEPPSVEDPAEADEGGAVQRADLAPYTA